MCVCYTMACIMQFVIPPGNESHHHDSDCANFLYNTKISSTIIIQCRLKPTEPSLANTIIRCAILNAGYYTNQQNDTKSPAQFINRAASVMCISAFPHKALETAAAIINTQKSADPN